MLILASVTINILVNSGLIGQANNAKSLTQQSAFEERLNIDVASILMEDVNRSLTLEILEVELAKPEFGYTTSLNDDELTVSKNGLSAILTRNGDNSFEIDIGGNTDTVNPDNAGVLAGMSSTAITFIVPVSWTREHVTINIYYPANTGGTNEYQISASGTDTGVWQEYIEAIEISQNCTVFARVSQNGDTIIPYYAKYIVQNIDNTPPTTPNLSITPETTSITATASGSTDANTFVYEYKIVDTGNEQVVQDWSTNNVFTNLINENEYTVYTRAKDMTGNMSNVVTKNIKVGALVLLSQDDTGYFKREDYSTFSYSGGSITEYQLNTNGLFVGVGIVTPVIDLTPYSEIRLYGLFGMYNDSSPVANYTQIGMILTNGVSWSSDTFNNPKNALTPAGQIPNVPSGYLSINISDVNTSIRVGYYAQTYAYFVFDKIVLYY